VEVVGQSHVNMAKHNNRIQTIENNREINHENGVHLGINILA
jgi:hypothetical protein